MRPFLPTMLIALLAAVTHGQGPISPYIGIGVGSVVQVGPHGPSIEAGNGNVGIPFYAGSEAAVVPNAILSIATPSTETLSTGAFPTELSSVEVLSPVKAVDTTIFITSTTIITSAVTITSLTGSTNNDVNSVVPIPDANSTILLPPLTTNTISIISTPIPLLTNLPVILSTDIITTLSTQINNSTLQTSNTTSLPNSTTTTFNIHTLTPTSTSSPSATPQPPTNNATRTPTHTILAAVAAILLIASSTILVV